MVDLPALPDAIENIQVLMIYNQMLKWLCGVLIIITVALIVDRERRLKNAEDKREREIERLKDKLENEQRYKKAED